MPNVAEPLTPKLTVSAEPVGVVRVKVYTKFGAPSSVTLAGATATLTAGVAAAATRSVPAPVARSVAEVAALTVNEVEPAGVLVVVLIVSVVVFVLSADAKVTGFAKNDAVAPVGSKVSTVKSAVKEPLDPDPLPRFTVIV